MEALESTRSLNAPTMCIMELELLPWSSDQFQGYFLDPSNSSSLAQILSPASSLINFIFKLTFCLMKSHCSAALGEVIKCTDTLMKASGNMLGMSA